MSAPTQSVAFQPTDLLKNIADTGRSGVAWLTTNSTKLAGSVADTAGKIWAVVSNFFSQAASFISSWALAGKEAMVAAFSQMHSLPTSTKIVAGAALAIAAVVGALAGRVFSPPADPECVGGGEACLREAEVAGDVDGAAGAAGAAGVNGEGAADVNGDGNAPDPTIRPADEGGEG